VFSFRTNHSRRDVLVTGVGMVTPLGCSANETWRRLIRNERGGRILTPDDIDHYEQLSDLTGVRLNGAPVDHADVVHRLHASSIMSPQSPEIQSLWSSEPLVAMSLLALHEALGHANLQPQRSADRLAVAYGSSKGGLRTAERLTEMLGAPLTSSFNQASRPPSVADDSRAEAERDRQFALLWSSTFSTDSATRAIAAVLGAQAGVSCPVAACGTGLISVLQGAAMIHAGICDVCIVGSADAGLRASVLSSFHRLRVTSRNHDAATACRPFDEARDGFIVGEGAAVLVLESREHAAARNQAGLASVVAGGWLSDPTGMTQIDASGAVVEELLRRTHAGRSLRPNFISLHGTGTESNDLAEARGISNAFGDAAPHCFGVKGALGHLLGAAGSVETVITILALHHRQIPGTINLSQQDPRCNIPLSSTAVRHNSLQCAAKLSLGFGGHVAYGVFGAENL